MTTVLGFLLDLRYLAMFGILLLCGTGLPLPEEVTLVGSGLMVGWGEANFWITSLACVAGILAGDSIIFGLGYHYGGPFLRSRPMRLFLSRRRQKKVARFFDKHGTKAVFFARFFAGVRIGVYAYAGSQRMCWRKFIFLDFLGALISGPTSIFLGNLAARHIVSDREEAIRYALHLVTEFGHFLLAGAVLAIAAYVAFRVWQNRRAAREPANGAEGASLPAAPVRPEGPEAGCRDGKPDISRMAKAVTGGTAR